MEQSNQQSLKKQLNPMNVWAIAFGCIIGWGSFINPGKKFLPNSGVAGTAIAMVLEKKNVYFVPFGQDDAYGKPTSLICDFKRIPDTLDAALRGRQLQPVLLE